MMVECNRSKNKLIVKNSLILYSRMFLAMFISLFTSRIVLQTLGVEDYGIYGVVGGIVSILGFINSSMSASTSRFITFELGQGDVHRLHLVFNNAFWVHLLIAFGVIIIVETFGLWFLINKMVIPEERMIAAHWVFQLSVLSVLLSFTQTPYTATIISHERMDIYAYAELINIFLKLLIVYILVVSNMDKLILYSILMFFISFGMICFYRIYCIKHFEECHINLQLDKSILKRMLVFSGWDLYGNLSVSFRNQGQSLILNMFFGVVVNAACSVANQVSGVIMAFGSNILTAVKPQITKSFATRDYERTKDLILYSSIGIIYMLALFSLPLIVEMKYVLRLWLGVVPIYTVTFCRFILVFNFFSALAMLMLTVPHAAEKNKEPSLVNGTVYLLSLPASYIVFKFFHIVWFSYFYNVISMIFGFIFITWLAAHYLPNFSFKSYILILLRNCAVLFVIVCILLIVHIIMKESFFRLFVISIISSIMIIVSSLYLGMNSRIRTLFFTILKKEINTIRTR